MAISDRDRQVLVAAIDLVWDRNHNENMKLLSLDVHGTSAVRVRSVVTGDPQSSISVPKHAYIKFLGRDADPIGHFTPIRRIIKYNST